MNENLIVSLKDIVVEFDGQKVLDGLSLDAVYENFVRQIAGEVLADKNGTTLKESVEQQKQREQIEKQTATLEAKIRKEKQPKKKFELVQKLSAMKDIRERGK